LRPHIDPEDEMANPVLSDKRFTATADELEPGWAAPAGAEPTATGTVPPPPTAVRPTATMSANGTFAKTFFLWVLLVAGGAFGWSQVTVDPLGNVTIPGWVFIPLFVALGFAMACIFAPKTAPVTAPLYAIAEGVFLGAISRVYEQQWSGIVLQAVLATLAVFVVCLALYVSGAVKVTNKFIFVVIAATAGIFVLYFVSFLLSIFGVDLTFWNQPSAFGILFSVAVCFVAALNLFVDFEMIRRMVVAGAPKGMEWYGAFGITVTIVWLYLEILRLLSKIRS
jgi:uncharacterized YccA/Bax inhibitor family protein